MERDRDSFKSLEKFESMIQDNSTVYLDLNERQQSRRLCTQRVGGISYKTFLIRLAECMPAMCGVEAVMRTAKSEVDEDESRHADEVE